MPTYRSCGDRFLGRWKQGEGEIDGERRFTEESERKRRTIKGENAAIRSVYGVLRLCFYACGTSACSPSTFGSPRRLLFALTRGACRGNEARTSVAGNRPPTTTASLSHRRLAAARLTVPGGGSVESGREGRREGAGWGRLRFICAEAE